MKLYYKNIFPIIGIIAFSIIYTNSFAQKDAKTIALAKQYYRTQNFEKAALLYEELFEKEPRNSSYYSFLYNSLLRINEYDKLEKIVKKQLKRNKTNLAYPIDLAYVYSQNNKNEESKKLYTKTIESLGISESDIRNVAYKFISYRLHEYVILTFEKGNKLFKDDIKFALEIADAYVKLNKADKAIPHWLLFLEKTPHQSGRIQNIFSRNLKEENFQEELEIQLYSKIQEKPKLTIYPELLIWLFTNQNEFNKALIQAKALDKKLKENGYRVMEIADIALQEKSYDDAILGFQYLIDKGEFTEFFRLAKSNILKARKNKVINDFDYTPEDLKLLKNGFKEYLSTYGESVSNVKVMRELANLEANYLGNLDSSIIILETILQYPNLDKKAKNAIKLDLGDTYILKDNVWEAVLLFAQVDKDEKDSPIGEDARYRNARLSYYNGDFEWAQAQMTVLKGATTELIANNALELSVFIINNLGLDTTTIPMEMFVKAELLMIQNKHQEAISKLNEIQSLFPKHNLDDDILFKKASIYTDLKQYKKAEKELLSLISQYDSDILGDNATYMLAELYHYKLLDKEKAKEYYQKIVLDYNDSILLLKARKRFRALRGDNL